MSSLAANIKRAVKADSRKIGVIAKQAGMAQSQLYAYCNGAGDPKADKLRALAKALKLPLRRLLK